MRLNYIRYLFSYVNCRLRSRKCKFLCIIMLIISCLSAIWLLITLYMQEDLLHYPPNINLYQIYEKEKLQIHSSLPPLWKIIFPLSSNYTEQCLIKHYKCNGNNNDSNNNSSLFQSSKCQAIDILLIIRSHVNNFNQRDAIRKTWGNQECYKNFGVSIRILFILGKQDDNNDNILNYSIPNESTHYDNSMSNIGILQKLYYEHIIHHDIIQFDFIDNGSNLLNKWIGSIDFIVKYCMITEKSFTLFLDDNSFLHPINLIQLLRRITLTQYRIYASGHVERISYPVRIPFLSKYISSSNYPFNIYPPYINSGTIILSMPVVQLLRVGFNHVTNMPYDDILLGIILLKFGISPIHLKNIYTEHSLDKQTLKQLQFISIHGYNDPSMIHSLWSTLNMNYACKINK
ncbi:unnamed protein product [Schistosoma rodhaini]|uniref:Hexosyltransferase n=1 Tax=Schistosoma rodhaini TaxID=6188 RepID=A0AA85F8G4_9TREM|nr:unnamed protein product [Schistosoma rodhaini]CAH8448961.1 unnamed protein product [Schistosoma rodhaini]CAH8485666.1 unnamed protein product [Schistosoma rodhaini]CAH8485711.1 unnamed protein product [Schistosoma rodhaini]